MNPDVKKRWVRALRSGKYMQGKGKLKSDRGYCCLGVLAQIEGKLDQSAPGGECLTATGKHSPKAGKFLGILSPSFARYCGLTRKTQVDLAEMNDEGADFKQIANHINATL
jgi:hypothetical protein